MSALLFQLVTYRCPVLLHSQKSCTVLVFFFGWKISYHPFKNSLCNVVRYSATSRQKKLNAVCRSLNSSQSMYFRFFVRGFMSAFNQVCDVWGEPVCVWVRPPMRCTRNTHPNRVGYRSHFSIVLTPFSRYLAAIHNLCSDLWYFFHGLLLLLWLWLLKVPASNVSPHLIFSRCRLPSLFVAPSPNVSPCRSHSTANKEALQEVGAASAEETRVKKTNPQGAFSCGFVFFVSEHCHGLLQ